MCVFVLVNKTQLADKFVFIFILQKSVYDVTGLPIHFMIVGRIWTYIFPMQNHNYTFTTTKSKKKDLNHLNMVMKKLQKMGKNK